MPSRALPFVLTICVGLLPAAPPQHLHDIADASGHRQTSAHRHADLHLLWADHDHDGDDLSGYHHDSADLDAADLDKHGSDSPARTPDSPDVEGLDAGHQESHRHESDTPGQSHDAARNLIDVAVLSTGSAPPSAGARVESTPDVLLVEQADLRPAWRGIARPVLVERGGHGPPRAPHASRPPPATFDL